MLAAACPAGARMWVLGSDGVRSQPTLARASCVALGLRPHIQQVPGQPTITCANLHVLCKAQTEKGQGFLLVLPCHSCGERSRPGCATRLRSPWGPGAHRLSTPTTTPSDFMTWVALFFCLPVRVRGRPVTTTLGSWES